MALTSSMEDYLEAVLILHQKRGSVRGVDIAVHLGVTKPSVSRAVKELSKFGHIIKKPMAHSPSQIQACKSLHRFMRNTNFSPGSSSKLVSPRILRRRTLAGWNTSSVNKAFRS